MIQDNLMVKKHNKLIELQGKLTTLEQKLFINTITMIDINDEDFKEYIISISEFKKLLGLKRKDFYEELDRVTDKLTSRLIKIEKQTDEKTISKFKTTLFSSVEYVEGQGFIKVLIDPKLKPYLIKLSERYTKYELKNVVSLKSGHSIRIYELLKQYQRIKKRSFQIDELKRILGLETNYSVFKDFEKRVLKVAEKEINELTDLMISYEKEKNGRKIDRINFCINTKQPDEDAERIKIYKEHNLFDFDKTRKLSGLEDSKLSDSQIIDIYEIASEISDRFYSTFKFDLDIYTYIRLNYEYTLKNAKKSIYSYLKKAVKEDFANARLKMVKEK